MKLTDSQLAELEERFRKSKEVFENYKFFTETITGIQVDLQIALSDSLKSVVLKSHTKAIHSYRMLQVVLKQDNHASPMDMSVRMKLLPTKFDQFNLHTASDLFVYKVDKYLAASMSVSYDNFVQSINKFCDGIDQLLVIYCTNKVS